MSYYVIIRGPAGAGKTTVARMVAKGIKARYISLDRILHRHRLDRIDGGRIKPENLLRANEEAIPLTVKTLQAGRNAVLDGNFYDRNHIRQFMKAIPFPGFAFTLKASPEDCVARDFGRRGRKRIGQKNVEQVHRLVSRFVFGTEIGTSGRSAREAAEEILGKLKV